MEVYIVRHAIAGERDPERWPDDRLRPLTPRGVKRFRRAARGVRRLAPSVNVVLSSPFTRAWQTAELLANEAGWPAPERCDALAAGRTPAEVVMALRTRGMSDTVALVGHEPYLSELVSYLLTGSGAGARLELRKGAVVALGLQGRVEPGTAVLRWLLQPRALRALGE